MGGKHTRRRRAPHPFPASPVLAALGLVPHRPKIAPEHAPPVECPIMARRALVLLLLCTLAIADPDPVESLVDTLVAQLGAEDFAVRQQAFEELDRLGVDALPWLEAHADHPDPEVARMVRRLTDSIRTRAERDGLDGLGNREDDFSRTEVFKRLVARGRDVLPLLLRVLDEEDARHPEYDYYRLRNVYAVLGEIVAPEDLDLLLSRLNAPNVQHRILVESILRKFSTVLVRKKVLAILADTSASPQQRAHLVEMCINSSFTGNEDRFHTLLVRLVDDPAELVRAAALRYLMIRRDETLLPKILSRTTDESTEVRSAALRALSMFRTPEVRDALLAALEDPQPEARAAALQSLTGAGGPDLAPRVRPLLEDPDPNVRSNAAQLLAAFGDRSALPALIALLAERNRDFLQRTLHAVVDALGRIRDPAALEPLFDLLADSSDEEILANYRYMILRAIIQIGGEAVLPRVEPWLADPEERNLHVVLDELARIDSPKVEPILLAVLANGDRTARASALRALVERDCAACAPLAAKALAEENDPWLLSEALKAIVWFGQTGSEGRILELLAQNPADNRNTGLFYALLRAVMVFRPAGAAPRIAEIAALAPTCRGLAVEALRELGDPAALPALRRFLGEEESPNNAFRIAVAMARLGEKGPAEDLLAGLADAATPPELLARAELLAALGRKEELAAILDRAGKAGSDDARASGPSGRSLCPHRGRGTRDRPPDPRSVAPPLHAEPGARGPGLRPPPVRRTAPVPLLLKSR